MLTTHPPTNLDTGDWETAAHQQLQQDKPAGPQQWPIARIVEKLSRELPSTVTETRKQGGATLTYVPWYQVNRILDKYAPGWSWEITKIETTNDRLFLVGRLTIPASDGIFYREATGTELLKEDKPILIPNPERSSEKIQLKDEFGRVVTEPRELAYGDSSSNAESQCFRRCAAKFGLGLYLYF